MNMEKVTEVVTMPDLVDAPVCLNTEVLHVFYIF